MTASVWKMTIRLHKNAMTIDHRAHKLYNFFEHVDLAPRFAWVSWSKMSYMLSVLEKQAAYSEVNVIHHRVIKCHCHEKYHLVCHPKLILERCVAQCPLLGRHNAADLSNLPLSQSVRDSHYCRTLNENSISSDVTVSAKHHPGKIFFS